jgi:broad specificity phosphatase PhoE
VAERASRLRLVAHGPTVTASELVFDDRGPLLRADRADLVRDRVSSWSSGPEPACQQSLAALSGAGDVLPALAGPDLGTWSGRPLADVAAEDPSGLQAWLTDPNARPHGGETLTELVGRLAGVLAGRRWPSGTSGLLLTPLAARALTVAALGGPAALVLALDVGYAGQVLLSRSGDRWRLLELLRRPSPPVS